jgi:hypothetical protein
MRHRSTIQALSAFVALACLTAGKSPAAANDLGPLRSYLSPDTDYATICRVPTTDVKAERNWARWNGEPIDLDDESLLVAAERQAGGTSLVPRNRVIARKLFEYLMQRNGPQRLAATHQLGQMLLDPSAGPVDVTRGVALIREAAAAFHAPALVTLGDLHQKGRHVPVDLTEASRAFTQAAALGDADGAIRLLDLRASGALGPTAPKAIEELARITLGMLHGELAKGDCSAVRKIGIVIEARAGGAADIALATRWYEAAVRLRDVDAALLLAERYRTGTLLNFDIRHAIELLTFAADEGSARAMRMLGEIYLFGDNVTADRAKSVRWLSRAGDARDVAALWLLARFHRGDFGTAPDYNAYVAALARINDLPDARPEFITELGRAYLDGLVGKPDPERGLAILERAAALGDSKALVQLADAALERGEFQPYVERIRSQLRSAANNGSGQAMRLMSELYACGIGTAPDPRLARLWLERAAATSDVASLKTLARQIAQEQGPRASERFAYLRRAALAGDRPSMVDLAVAYRDGLGTEPDPSEMEFWRTRALSPGKGRNSALLALARANLATPSGPTGSLTTQALLEGAVFDGDADVLTEVGKFYLRGGPGLPRARDKGVQLLIRAASVGNVEAMLELGHVHEDELRESRRGSMDWLRNAAMAGSPRAIIALALGSSSEAERWTWLRRAESMRICEGEVMVRFAMAYATLPGTEGTDRARFWLARARQMPNLDGNALYLVSRALETGIGGPDERAESREYLIRAANAGHVEAMRDLGNAEIKQASTYREVDQAMGWFEQAFAGGDQKAPIDAAQAFSLHLQIGEELSNRILALLENAANAGSPRAMRELGVALQRGRGAAIRAEDGAKWLLRAAESGDVIAMREIAMAYASGFGVSLSASESARWMKRAADGGDAKAMRELSSALTVGFGVPVNLAEAEKWAKAATTASQKPVE